MNKQAQSFQQAVDVKTEKTALLPNSLQNPALETFCEFLKSINDTTYIENEIASVYAENAYLNDTLKTLQSRDEIKEHFIKTSNAMTGYEVEITDIAASSKGYYIRWDMQFTAPKLSGGKNIHTIGMTYAQFNADGKVILHQDFWDSTEGFFSHIPVLRSGIKMIKSRL